MRHLILLIVSLLSLGRLALAQIAQGDTDGAAQTLANPLAALEMQQYFVIYDINLARTGLARLRKMMNSP